MRADHILFRKVFSGASLRKWAVALTIFVGGPLWLTACRSAHHHAHSAHSESGASGLPSFICGPVGVLLTNLDGFSAHVTLETPLSPNQVRTTSGDLLGRGSLLLFAPSDGPDGMIFIWDASRSSGYALNEALQGYAPISSSLSVTGVVGQSVEPLRPARSFNGHSAQGEGIVVKASDGSEAHFLIWRTAKLQSLPLRIESERSENRFTATLSTIRLEAPKANLFLPPESFTSYPSLQAMQDEMLGRKVSPRSHATDSGESFRAAPQGHTH